LIYMIHNQQGVFYIFVGVVANLFIFCCLIAPIIDISDRAKYSLVINRQGIKNTTCRDEVFLPWTEFEKISILENVKIRGNRGYDYYTFIYISNSDLDEDYLRKIIKSNASHIYITAESKLVITIWPYSKEETEALYSKLTEYINKFNPQNDE